MKKVISVKEIVVILISLVVLVISTSVNATNTGLQFENNSNNNYTPINQSEYENAQLIGKDNNVAKEDITSNPANNTINNSTNNTKVYNTNNSTNLPQTGIEDYNIGILLIICIASAMFAYRKINDYRNI